jgi:hypothetical protein
MSPALHFLLKIALAVQGIMSSIHGEMIAWEEELK